MNNKLFKKYYLFTCLGIFIASFYPLYMGVRVICDMFFDGVVMKENYPKYIIPYTPICVAIMVCILLMPLFLKFAKKFALLGSSLLGVGIFFATEILFEQKVVVSATETVVKLEDWQMFMCYVPPEGWGEKVTTYKTQTPVEILMGEYNPAFKLHFYIISLLIILSVLNCLYGFAKMVIFGDRKSLKALVMQSVATVAFMGMCILACFTAFWRDGSLEVSVLSATLMTIFFILFGMVGGIYAGSFFIGKTKWLSIVLPTVVSAALTVLMYVGEMILLHGHLYSFGKGFLFDSLPGIILAPFDIMVIFVTGCLTCIIIKKVA